MKNQTVFDSYVCLNHRLKILKPPSGILKPLHQPFSEERKRKKIIMQFFSLQVLIRLAHTSMVSGGEEADLIGNYE